MKLKKGKEPVEEIKAVDVTEYAREYVGLRDQKKRLEDRMSFLSEYLKEHARNHGVEDDKGSHYIEAGNIVVGCVSKKKITFNQEVGIDWLKDNGYEDAVKTVEFIDEDKVNSLLESDEISFDDVKEFLTVKEFYSVDVKPKKKENVIEEVEQMPMAASRKSSFVKRKR